MKITGRLMLKKFIISFMFATASISTNVSFAGGLIFDPTDTCVQQDKEVEYFNSPEMIFWASGYIAGRTGLSESIHELGLNELDSELGDLCEQFPNSNHIALIEKYIQIHSNDLGSANQGKKMLEDFIASDQSLADFFASLQPSSFHISAVYKEPLATNLTSLYEKMYASMEDLKLDPEYVSVIVQFSTTQRLANDELELSKFPGGYAKVKDYFIFDYPIASFEFVKAGETSGLRFTGLIFVGNKWVLMPKPWRGLK